MTGPVRVGIIGAGPWVPAFYVPVLAPGPETAISGIWARRPEAAAQLAQDALVATLAYRLVSYWLPLPAGLGAYIAFRVRYGSLGEEAPEHVPPMPRSGH